CDFSYVSNQSMLPAGFHEQQRNHFASHPVALQWVDRLYVEMEEAFHGRPEAARLSVKWAIERLEEKEGPCPLSAENRERIVRHYLDPLAELLFRQKTLEWVADYCDRTGRSLHLYGQGWDAHPRFERYARGRSEERRVGKEGRARRAAEGHERQWDADAER